MHYNQADVSVCARARNVVCMYYMPEDLNRISFVFSAPFRIEQFGCNFHLLQTNLPFVSKDAAQNPIIGVEVSAWKQ